MLENIHTVPCHTYMGNCGWVHHKVRVENPMLQCILFSGVTILLLSIIQLGLPFVGLQISPLLFVGLTFSLCVMLSPSRDQASTRQGFT